MNEDDRALLNFWEAESPDNKLQILISKLQRSTKLQAQKPTCAPFAPASVFGVWCLRFGTSLELGVWCLVFRSAAAQKPRYAPGGVGCWLLDVGCSRFNAQRSTFNAAGVFCPAG